MKFLETSQMRHVDPRTLHRHPENDNLCRPHTAEEHEALKTSIESSGGISDPIKICGTGCASPPGTLLDGHERTTIAIELGMPLVPTIVMNNLSEVDEREALVMGNFAKTHGRRLSEREIAHLEKQLLDIHKPGRGARTDKKGGGRGPTNKRVASLQNERLSKVKDRQTVFFNPLSTAELQRAVDAKQIPRSIAAQKIRKTASRIARGEVSQVAALKELEIWVTARITSPPKRGRPAIKKDKLTRAQENPPRRTAVAFPKSSTPLDVRIRDAGVMLERGLRAVLDVTLDTLDDISAKATRGEWKPSNGEQLTYVLPLAIALAEQIGGGPRHLVGALADILSEEVRS